jgi:hypothetical protein
MAYEILYGGKVDLFDKIKEVVFSQLFPCVLSSNICPQTGYSQFLSLIFKKNAKMALFSKKAIKSKTSNSV